MSSSPRPSRRRRANSFQATSRNTGRQHELAGVSWRAGSAILGPARIIACHAGDARPQALPKRCPPRVSGGDSDTSEPGRDHRCTCIVNSLTRARLTDRRVGTVPALQPSAATRAVRFTPATRPWGRVDLALAACPTQDPHDCEKGGTMIRSLVRVAMAGVTFCAAGAVMSAQQQTTTETKRFEVIAVEGNDLVVR